MRTGDNKSGGQIKDINTQNRPILAIFHFTMYNGGPQPRDKICKCSLHLKKLRSADSATEKEQQLKWLTVVLFSSGLPFQMDDDIVGCGGSLVDSSPFVRRVVGSNPAAATT